MIDFHSHILPHLDDGAQSFKESLTLAKMYVDAGFTHVTATPHCLPGTLQVPDPQFVLKKIDKLNTLLEKNKIQLKILQGMEIGIDPEILVLIQQKRILPLGESATLLMETPFKRLPQDWEQIMMKLKNAGYKILMGHPERSEQLIKDPGICNQFIELGLSLQVTWDSFLGNNGPSVKRLADYIIFNGYAHVMATDTHRVYARNPGNVNKGYKIMTDQIGLANTALLCNGNPRRILQNRPPKPIQMDDLPNSVRTPDKWRSFIKKVF